MTYYLERPLRECKKIVAKELKGKEFNSVLEVGCQWGENLAGIREEFPDVKLVGIDIDVDTLESSRSDMEKRNIEISYGNILSIPFPDKSFDVVFVEAVFCMLHPDLVEDALKEVMRVAKKYVILVELDNNKIGEVKGGRTGANWSELLKFNKRRITTDEWDAAPWNECGVVIICQI